MRTHLNKIILGIIFVLPIAINLITLKNGHNWGDDFSQYIIHAQNIIDHNEYNSNIMVENIFTFPFGFPLLIAPIIKIFGVNYILLKSINVLFWYLTILILFPVFSKRLGNRNALLCSLLLSWSSFFFVYKQNILADVPFLFFTFWAITKFIKYSENKRVGDLAFFIVLMTMTLFIRSAGLILFISAIFYLITIGRDKRGILATIVALTLAVGIQSYWIGMNPGFFAEIGRTSPVTVLNSVVQNFPVVFLSIIWFLCPGQTPLSLSIFSALYKIILIVAPALYLWILFVFIIKVKARTLSFIGCFYFFYVSTVVFWSLFPMPLEVFVRFILPLVPLTLIFSAEILSSLNLRNLKILFQPALYGFIVLNIINIVFIFNFNDDVIFRKGNQELIAWVRENMKPQEHFMFWKPRALALLTGRTGTAPWISADQKDSFFQRINKWDISYVIAIKGKDELLIENLNRLPARVDVAWENKHYKVFKVD